MAGFSAPGGGMSPGPIQGGGQMSPGGPGGMSTTPQQPPMQFGPESFLSLLMSMLMGGPQQMGQAAGSGTAVGQGSLGALLPQLMAFLSGQGGAMSPGGPGGGAMSPGGPGGAPGPGGGQMSPGGPGGGMMSPGGPMGGIIQILQMLGMGNSGGTAPGRATMPIGRGGPPAQ